MEKTQGILRTAIGPRPKRHKKRTYSRKVYEELARFKEKRQKDARAK